MVWVNFLMITTEDHVVYHHLESFCRVVKNSNVVGVALNGHFAFRLSRL